MQFTPEYFEISMEEKYQQDYNIKAKEAYLKFKSDLDKLA